MGWDRGLQLLIFTTCVTFCLSFTGHVCQYSVVEYRTATSYYYHSCGWWSRCRGTNYYQVSQTGYKQKCCSGYSANQNNACVIPICSPACKNGGTCIRPGICQCPTTHYGTRCEKSQCSWKFPCFPGTCDSGTRCECSPGFGGSHCGTMINAAQGPDIVAGEATLSDRIDNRDHLEVKANYPLSTTAYVKQQDWNHVNLQWASSYNFSSPPQFPTYIRSLVLGVVSGRSQLRLYRKDGRVIFIQTLPCSNGDSSSAPNQRLSNCTVEHSFTHAVRDGDRLEVDLSSTSGGYKEVFNADASPPSVFKSIFNGRQTTKKLTFEFDYQPPKHLCQDLGQCAEKNSTLMLTAARVNGQPQLEIQWANWVDVTSGIDRHICIIYRGGIRNGSAVETKTWRQGDPWIKYTANTGQFSVLMKVVDRAGNEAIITKTIDIGANLPTVSPNLCTNKDCFPGLCIPDSGRCLCAAGFSGDNCNTISGDIQLPQIKSVSISLHGSSNGRPFEYDSNSSEGPNLVNVYTNNLGLTDMKLSWEAEYSMKGDLPSHSPAVSSVNIGLVSNKAEIEMVAGDGSVKKETSYNCPINVPTCNKTHTLINPRKDRYNLKIVLEATNGGHKIVSGSRVEFEGRTLRRQINIHYDTEAPYYYCAAGSRRCENQEMEVKVAQVTSKEKKDIILTLTWGADWRDSLSGIGTFRYYIYIYPGTRDIGLEDAPVFNGSWAQGDDYPTFTAGSSEDAYSVVLIVYDKAGNNVTIRRDVDLTSPRVSSILGTQALVSGESDQSGLAALPIIAIVLVVIVVTLLAVAVIRRRRGHPWLWKEEKLQFFRKSTRERHELVNFNNYEVEDTDDQGIYYDNAEFAQVLDVSSADITLGVTLCNGNFAVIKLVEWTAPRHQCLEVAVKMLKDPTKSADKKLMMEKIDFVGNIPRHENVLTMLGKVTDDMKTGPYMILEYCKNGTLRDWLLAQKARGELSSDTADHMAEYAVQIASAMEHLSNNMIVHKKLMSKNVLLNGKMVAKVMGFEGKDAVKEKSRLPTKWMALEVLQDPQLNFTTASDVWAYGITLWEIYSLGDLPYTTGNISKLIGILTNGIRPERPADCPDEIYNEVILRCLYNDPLTRPTFQQIKDAVNNYLHPAPDVGGMYYGLDD